MNTRAVGGLAPGHQPMTVVDEVRVSVSLDPWLSLRALSGYSGLSIRTVRYHLTDPSQPIPSYRVGGKLLVRRSEFDAWMAHHRNQKAQALIRLAAADAQALLSARAHNVP